MNNPDDKTMIKPVEKSRHLVVKIELPSGIVFYITDEGLHGLGAARVDQPKAIWGCAGTFISGADGTAVGTDAQNTLDILSGCPERPIAASVAFEYSLNGFSDWFLPSKDELDLMYQRLHVQGLGGFARSYWSSSKHEIGLGSELKPKGRFA